MYYHQWMYRFPFPWLPENTTPHSLYFFQFPLHTFYPIHLLSFYYPCYHAHPRQTYKSPFHPLSPFLFLLFSFSNLRASPRNKRDNPKLTGQKKPIWPRSIPRTQFSLNVSVHLVLFPFCPFVCHPFVPLPWLALSVSLIESLSSIPCTNQITIPHVPRDFRLLSEFVLWEPT
jgi:hypothetical protein